MTAPNAMLALLGLVTLAGLWRAFVRGRAAGWPTWRRFAVVALQPLLAAALAWALWPPAVPAPRETLVVLTAGASAPDALAEGERRVVMPEAVGPPAMPDAASPRPAIAPHPATTFAPDLATALRAHPAARSLRVLGEGLVPRDQAAARGLPLVFEPGPEPAGLVELEAPASALAGATLRLRGRLAGVAGARATLHDPTGARVAAASPGEDGRFTLQAAVGAPGALAFELHITGADDALLERVALPLQVSAGTPHRLWLIAGAPNPEWRALRRWAVDAGLDLHSDILVGAGIRLGDGARRLDAGTLADTDLLLLDERSWRSLGPRGRATVREAVRGGLGVLLRLTGPLSAAERAELRADGFVLEPGDLVRGVTLPADVTPAARGEDIVPTLSRWPGRLRAPAGAVLLASAEGEALAAWRGLGEGRFGLWLLSDTFRWSQAGYPQAHARLWADAVATLARPRAAPAFALPAFGRVDERASLCGLGDDAALVSPEGLAQALVIDPASGPAGCAAAWPRAPGLHVVRSGGHAQPWPVLAADALPAMAARERREATRALAAFAPSPDAAAEQPPVPGPRWPGWLAFLLVAALAWLLERRRPTHP